MCIWYRQSKEKDLWIHVITKIWSRQVTGWVIVLNLRSFKACKRSTFARLVQVWWMQYILWCRRWSVATILAWNCIALFQWAWISLFQWNCISLFQWDWISPFPWNCIFLFHWTWISTNRRPLKSGRVGCFLEASLISAEWQSEMRKLRWNVRRDIWSKEDISLFQFTFSIHVFSGTFFNIYWLGISLMKSWLGKSLLKSGSQFRINPLYPLLSRFSIWSPELLLSYNEEFEPRLKLHLHPFTMNYNQAIQNKYKSRQKHKYT